MNKIILVIIGLLSLYGGIMTYYHHQQQAQWKHSLMYWQQTLQQEEQELETSHSLLDKCLDTSHQLKTLEIDLSACQEREQMVQDVFNNMSEK